MKSRLKVSGTKRLTLKYEELLSNFPLKFNMRRYNLDAVAEAMHHPSVYAFLHIPVGPGRCCSPRHRHAFSTLVY
jgi:hypothetical protein